VILIFGCIFLSSCSTTKTVRLKIDSNPKGARISIDGEDIGEAPVSSNLNCVKNGDGHGTFFHQDMGGQMLSIEAVQADGQTQEKTFMPSKLCGKADGETVPIFFNMKRKDSPKEQKIDLKIKNE
jgi:hypothetical protein